MRRIELRAFGVTQVIYLIAFVEESLIDRGAEKAGKTDAEWQARVKELGAGG